MSRGQRASPRRATAVLLPGFNGTARQPLLLALQKALTPLGVRCVRLALPRGRPSAGLAVETAFLAKKTAQLQGPLLLVGRSFGGRVAARFAAAHEVGAVVLLGFPVRPPGRKRPEDEAALRALRVPTLVVQNTHDPLGPLRVLRPLVKNNPRLRLASVDARGHGFGRRQAEAVAHTVAFVDAYLRRRGV